MTAVELISLVASIVSVVLGILAIWLSLVFFRMSSDLAKQSTEAANAINAGVERLEKLFDRLYADTFSIMRDTVTDMRKHIWADSSTVDDEVEQRVLTRLEETKEELRTEVTHILGRQQVTDDKLNEVSKLMERAVAQGRKLEIEAREETLRGSIIKLLQENSNGLKADQLVSRLRSRFGTTGVIYELEKLATEKIVTFDTPYVASDSTIKLNSGAGLA